MKHLLIFTIITFFSYSSTFSAVISGNMTPSSIDTPSETAIDLDNNGVFDFKIKQYFAGMSTYVLEFTGLNGTQFETDGNQELIGYADGASVGLNTYQDTGIVASLYIPEGQLKNIGLKFKIGAEFHCAYIELMASSYSQGFFLFGQYGYETESVISSCITAGASGTAYVPDNNFDFQFTFFQDIQNNSISVNFNQSLRLAEIEILDLMGRKVKSIQIIDDSKIHFNVDFPKGMYILNVKSNGERLKQSKILIQ